MISEDTWTPADEDCPFPERYSAPDAEATENEVSQLLATLAATLRADRVLETGTYKGFTAQAIGQALQAQGFGTLDTLEIRKDRAEVALRACEGLPVNVFAGSSLDFTPEGDYDLMFFDSEPEHRALEMERFKPNAKARCVWAVHDTRYHKLRKALEGLLEAGVIKPWFDLPTPRGLAIGRFA